VEPGPQGGESNVVVEDGFLFHPIAMMREEFANLLTGDVLDCGGSTDEVREKPKGVRVLVQGMMA